MLNVKDPSKTHSSHTHEGTLGSQPHGPMYNHGALRAIKSVIFLEGGKPERPEKTLMAKERTNTISTLISLAQIYQVVNCIFTNHNDQKGVRLKNLYNYFGDHSWSISSKATKVCQTV